MTLSADQTQTAEEAPNPLTRNGCRAALEMLRAGYGHTLPIILQAYGVSLADVRAYERGWRERVGYEGPSLLPPA